MSDIECLRRFVERVRARCVERVAHERFSVAQSRLCRQVVEHFFSHSSPDDWAQPLGLLYCCYRALGRATDETTVEVGAFCTLYLAAADLFDDVQDDDLAGKPHEASGAPIATNDALTLLVMGLDALRHAADEDLRYLELFNRVSLSAVAAQHRDLVGISLEDLSRLDSPDVRQLLLATYEGKTSSVALLTECGALLGGADATVAQTYQQIGAALARMVQVVDDVRDLFGKDFSPDLAAGKLTYPLACFFELASSEKRHRFDALRVQALSVDGGGAALDPVRELFFDAGAVAACAETLEDLRQVVHQRTMSLVAGAPSQSSEPRSEHRMLVSIADTLSSTLYEPEPLDVSATLLRFGKSEGTGGSFRRRILDAAQRFSQRLGTMGAPEVPPLIPWHQPIYLFEPSRHAIYFPDVDGLPGEVLPFHAAALGLSLPETEDLVRETAPFLVAHELVHVWRHELGRLGADAWHEEHVANCVALAVAREVEPAAAQAAVDASRRLVEGAPALPNLEDLARDARSAQPNRRDYGVGLSDAAIVHAHLVLLAAAEGAELDTLWTRFLMLETERAAE